jgi:heme exporter protein C
MAFAFTFLFVTLYLMAIRNEILRRRLRRLSIRAATAQEQNPRGRVIHLGGRL